MLGFCSNFEEAVTIPVLHAAASCQCAILLNHLVRFFWPPRCSEFKLLSSLSVPQELSVVLQNVPFLSSFSSMDAQSVAQGDKAIDTLYSISNILDTGLDRETLRILVGLCETGINPEALALIVKELRREAAAIKGPTQEAAAAGHS